MRVTLRLEALSSPFNMEPFILPSDYGDAFVEDINEGRWTHLSKNYLGRGINLWAIGTEADGQYAVTDAAVRTLLYKVRYVTMLDPVVKMHVVIQDKVWRNNNKHDGSDALSRDIPSYMFWDNLFPKTHGIETGSGQSPQGKRFWLDRVPEATKHHARVLLVDRDDGNPKVLDTTGKGSFVELLDELNIYGPENQAINYGQRRIGLITDKVLPDGLQMVSPKEWKAMDARIRG